MNNSIKLALINCGYITEYLVNTNKHLNTSIKYLNTLVNRNFLIKEYHMLFGKINGIYSLSKVSLNKIRNEGFYIYKHDTSQLEHDYLLQKVFLSLSDNERYSWQNETALKARFGKNSTTSDALFAKGNKIIAVEILTPSYDKKTIQKKMQFISKVCDDYIILNTKDFSWRVNNE